MPVPIDKRKNVMPDRKKLEEQVNILRGQVEQRTATAEKKT